MFSALKASIKFHALYTKSSIQERLGKQDAADQTMQEARQVVYDYTEKFKSNTTTR